MTLSIKLGDRVAGMDSYYVGTVIAVWENSCLVEFDTHGAYLEGRKRREVKFFSGYGSVKIAKPYQEWHNACGMYKEGVATCIPQLPIEWRKHESLD